MSNPLKTAVTATPVNNDVALAQKDNEQSATFWKNQSTIAENTRGCDHCGRKRTKQLQHPSVCHHCGRGCACDHLLQRLRLHVLL